MRFIVLPLVLLGVLACVYVGIPSGTQETEPMNREMNGPDLASSDEAAGAPETVAIFDYATNQVTTMDRVTKSEQAWQEQLTNEQYHVARQKGTERAFSGAYHNCRHSINNSCTMKNMVYVSSFYYYLFLVKSLF